MQVEKLLLELQSMPEDGAQVPQSDRNGTFKRAYSNGNLGGEDQGASLEDARSRLLERIASEMNRLKFYVARAEVRVILYPVDMCCLAISSTPCCTLFEWSRYPDLISQAR